MAARQEKGSEKSQLVLCSSPTPTDSDSKPVTLKQKRFSLWKCSNPASKTTREIQNQFNRLMDRIEGNVMDRTVGDIMQHLQSYLQDAEQLGDICDVFNNVKVDLKWYDVEALDDICEKLELNNNVELNGQRMQYRTHLKQYFASHLAETVSTMKTHFFEIATDVMWDPEDLQDNCDEICRKIMTILGRCTKDTTVRGRYEDPNLVNIHFVR